VVSILKHLQKVIILSFILSSLFSQSATVQTIARAGGASADQVPNGWYNIVAAQSDGWSFTVSGFTSGGRYTVKANMDDGGTWNNVGDIKNNPGTAFTFTVDQNTVNNASNVSVADGNKIYFQVQDMNGDGVSQWQGDADVTGGISSCDCFYVDVTRPTVSSYDDQYVKNGATVTVTGSGFKSPHNQPATQDVTVDGQSYSLGGVANNTTLTFDVGLGNYKGYVVVTDAAGNSSNTSVWWLPRHT